MSLDAICISPPGGSGGGGGFTASQRGVFNARLDRVGAGELSLGSGAISVGDAGQIIEIHGEVFAAQTFPSLLFADNLIGANGQDLGAGGMSNATLYYIYASNSQATDFPGELRASTTAPAGSYGGFPYLNSVAGNLNASYWRYVGMAYPVGGDFLDQESARLVMSHYNKIRKELFICPNYANGNTQTNYTTNLTGSWISITASAVQDYVRILSDIGNFQQITTPENCVHVHLQAVIRSIGAPAVNIQLGIGLSNTNPIVTTGALTTAQAHACIPLDITPTVGYNELFMNVMGANTGTAQFTADESRNGATRDPYATYLTGDIWC